jgi:hypothetical protein
VSVGRFKVDRSRFTGSQVQGSQVHRFTGSQVHRFKVHRSGFSPVAGLKSGQFIRERNFEKANNEYRTRNNEFRSKVFYRFILF